jgi:glycosyltransferase involved in cell wall biosynthesis
MSLVSIFRTQIFTVHDPLYYLTKARNYKFTSLFFILERILYCRVNLVHFISNYAKEMSLLPSKNRYKIIHNTSFLEDSLKSNSIVREKVFCEVTQILIVRSIELRARLDLILEVAKHLGNNYEFTIVGKGPLLDYFVNKVKFENINNINFKSYIPDLELIEYYSNTDIVIVPAEFGEGFGLPIIEGYLFNKIVLASNKCAIPEIIFSDVFLFDNNVSSIVDKILSTKCMKKYNFEGYYYEKFSNKIILNKFRQLYSTNI